MKKQMIFAVFVGCAVVLGLLLILISNVSVFASPASHSEEIVQSEITTTNTGFSSEKIITTNAFGANAVGAADLDNDGDLDVFASCNKNDQQIGHEKIEWYENTSGDGSTWTVHSIRDFWDGNTDIVGADLDADGDVDLVVPAADHTLRVSWFENDGASPPGFTERYVTVGYGNGYLDVQAIDMNQDGSLDVLVAAGYDTDEILWFKSDGGTTPSFTMNKIDDSLTEPRGVFGADLDQDGDIDAIATDINENKVIWYESTGGTSPTFTSHAIAGTAGVGKSVFSTDIDQDGDNDIIAPAPADGKVYLFENDGSSPPAFHAHSIEENAPGARAVYAIDVDLDTDVDIVYASYGDDTIAWLENLDTVPPSFQKHVLGTTADAASNVYAADIDNDGDPDVLSASAEDNTIAWYENQSAALVPPNVTIDSVLPTLVAVGEPVTAQGSFTDPGSNDTHSAAWDWGDTNTSAGTVSGLNVGPDGHAYTEAGIYTIQLTVTDSDGNADTDTFEFVVVYDPKGGFVTGGGWIWSEAGWCRLDDTCANAEGKANFGFVSKYKKGATVPTGNTEFNLKAGGLNFHSDSYQWLVVNQGGTNAQYKGLGTVNGNLAPNNEAYKFILWAGDGESDTFRIKIWYEVDDTEIVVYDNGFDQEIGGGSIVIHTKK